MIQSLKRFFNNTKYLFSVIIVCGIYSGVLYNQTMPLSEGWYTYYAQCINRGQVVYKDFDYLFTPLYIYFLVLFTIIFVYNIIFMRICGIVFYCTLYVVIFLVIKEVFGEKKAVIATCVSMLYLQTEMAQVFYDYVRLMDIFAGLTVLFHIKWIKNICKSIFTSRL